MKLSEFLCQEAVLPNLQATDRDGAIQELVQAVADAGRLDPAQSATVASCIIARERQGSTGFGRGVAVPHVKHPAVSQVVAAIGRCAGGLDFASLDRAPVYCVVLLLSPPDAHDLHLEAMERIFRHLQRDQFRSALRQAETRESILDLVREADDAR